MSHTERKRHGGSAWGDGRCLQRGMQLLMEVMEWVALLLGLLPLGGRGGRWSPGRTVLAIVIAGLTLLTDVTFFIVSTVCLREVKSSRLDMIVGIFIVIYVLSKSIAVLLMLWFKVMLVTAGHLLHAALADANVSLKLEIERHDFVNPKESLRLRALCVRYIHLRGLHQQLSEILAIPIMGWSLEKLLLLISTTYSCISYGKYVVGTFMFYLFLMIILMGAVSLYVLCLVADRIADEAAAPLRIIAEADLSLGGQDIRPEVGIEVARLLKVCERPLVIRPWGLYTISRSNMLAGRARVLLRARECLPVRSKHRSFPPTMVIIPFAEKHAREVAWDGEEHGRHRTRQQAGVVFAVEWAGVLLGLLPLGWREARWSLPRKIVALTASGITFALNFAFVFIYLELYIQVTAEHMNLMMYILCVLMYAFLLLLPFIMLLFLWAKSSSITRLLAVIRDDMLARRKCSFAALKRTNDELQQLKSQPPVAPLQQAFRVLRGRYVCLRRFHQQMADPLCFPILIWSLEKLLVIMFNAAAPQSILLDADVATEPEKTDPDVETQVARLLKVCERPLVIRPCGLYTVSRSNLLAILLTVSTYAVVLLQFNAEDLASGTLPLPGNCSCPYPDGSLH
ncbi:hypothetical protein O3P69_020864 [Scylla paramamosain]|uniref:Gustatory receptor n=1 Tax=Scylla paramamosain TaxID=85552 RepID=A0AAW0TRG3_SCYPA